MSIPVDLPDELLQLPETSEFFIASVNDDGGISSDRTEMEKIHVTDNVIISEEKPTWYQCTVCQKKFRTKTHIWYHEFCGKEGDAKPFKCPECGMGFVSKSHFQQQSCEECGKTFSKKEHLRLHMALHTDERPFKCKACSKEFKYETNLKRHQLTHNDTSLQVKYTNFGVGRHSCSECNRGFQLLKDLRRHELIHTGEKPFSCDSCERKFSRKDLLERHVLSIHKGIKRKWTNEKQKCGTTTGKNIKAVTSDFTPTSASTTRLQGMQ
ncbi:unnamed protein product [Allacma fusca]|uniref:C2H2-type domain-containing protein n=1 Tax=Allacma fusca TaxID=39272 RepID=A0A8J2P5I5_9HEXA|nr:unnamed protein product [Allacma fusca]